MDTFQIEGSFPLPVAWSLSTSSGSEPVTDGRAPTAPLVLLPPSLRTRTRPPGRVQLVHDRRSLEVTHASGSTTARDRLDMTASTTLRSSSLIAGAAALVLLAGLAPPAAQADTLVDSRAFGLHVPQIANGVVPTVSYGSVRLWDSGVAGARWSSAAASTGGWAFDRAVSGGQRPERADPLRARLHPDVGGLEPVAGHLPEQGCGIESEVPVGLAPVGDRCRSPARHRRSTPTRSGTRPTSRRSGRARRGQMARLTLEAKRIIRGLDPTAVVVAASSTVRLRSAFNRFFPGLPEGTAPGRLAGRRLLHPHLRAQHGDAGAAGEVRTRWRARRFVRLEAPLDRCGTPR